MPIQKSQRSILKFNKPISREKALLMSPVVLAFIGDSVQTLFVRKKIALETDYKSGRLNEIASQVLRAKAQARLADSIFPNLTEEEKDIFRRGRNAKKPSHAKNAKVSEYNKSTGIEAVIGFLYLCDDEERLNYVLNYQIEEENNEG